MIALILTACLSTGHCEPAMVEIFQELQQPLPDKEGPEQWRHLVEFYFHPSDVDTAMCLMWHESRGDHLAKNPNSSASGLFQHLKRFWHERTEKAGWHGANIFDPEANIAMAAWLKYSTDVLGVDGWQHWTPYQRGLCR